MASTALGRTAAAQPSGRAPTPAYRPQLVPKVLQAKRPGAHNPAGPAAQSAAPRAQQPARPATAGAQTRAEASAVAASRPGGAGRAAQQPARPEHFPRHAPGASQPKPRGARPASGGAAAQASPRPAPPPSAVQRLASKVVQAVKFYPNLHPGAVERVDPGSVFKLTSFTDQYRLQKTGNHGVYVPNQQYNFVRTQAGEMLVHNRYRHPSIAEGHQVLYAGEVFFNNGKLEWWSNGSGHYQPDAEDARQAALPLDNFYTYQQVIKGEHKRKKS